MGRETISQASTTHQSEVPAVSGLLQRSQQTTTIAATDRETNIVAPATKHFKTSGFKQNFSRIPLKGGPLPGVQAKLTIGQPGDKYEQEADRVAAQVVAMPDSYSGGMASPSIQQLHPKLGQPVQRQPDLDEDEEPLQAKHQAGSSAETLIQRQADGDDEEEMLQAKREVDAKKAIPDINLHSGGGRPLAPPVRNFMEPRFNRDFGQVRLHTDGAANRMARSLNAQAFTHKQDIFFRAGQYQPNTKPGQELLAHELTHVVQQGRGAHPLNGQRSPVRAITQTVGSEEIVSLRRGDGAIAVPSVVPLASTGSEPAVPVSEEPASAKPENELSISGSSSGNAIATEAVLSATNTVADNADSKADKESEKTEETVEKVNAVGEKAAANKAQGGEVLEKAIAKAPASAAEDPAFRAVVKRAKGIAKQQKTHQPAKGEAKSAQAAAVPPASELVSKGQDRQVQEMSQQQPGTFSADAFIDALMTKIAAIVPQDEKAAEKFKTNNKLATVKQSVSAQVATEKQQAADPIAKKNKEAPNTSGIQPKPVTPLVEKSAGPQPTHLKANRAAPKAKTAAEVSQPLEKNSQQLDQQMAAGEITNEQLATSGEPQFTAALAAKQETQTHAKTGPDAYRKDETAILTQAQKQSQGTGKAQVAGMHGQRGKLLTQVMGQQTQAKSKDEAARANVATTINGIYDKTKTDVTTILAGLDTAVNQQFEAGAKVAKQQFEAYVGQEMDAYKEKRYGAWYDVRGYGKRLRDAWKGLPPEVGIIFERGRDLYVGLMRKTLRGIANHVATTLTQAKQRIADGKKELKSYVVGLAPSLQKVGQEATTAIQGKFDQLEAQVNSKQDQLVDSLAQKYQENLKSVNARVEQLKKENQGLLARAKGLIVGTIETILKLKTMLLQVLAKAAETVKGIIKDPIGFLKNLIRGLKQGFQNFVKNILKHLQSGLIGWLTGALGPIGIQIPKDVFSLKGIFSLVTQILGVTWDFIRRKAVKLFGEKTVSAMEKSVEIVQILMKDGVGGLWKHLQDQFTDLKESVLGEIKNLVVVQVITAGVKWVLGLLNPASAFVKAAMAIYDIVMFFVNRGSQIVELMKSVVDSVAAVASGSVGAVAEKIEGALVRSLPVMIGFLAALLGLSGLAQKVQGIVGRIRKRVEVAIDKLLLKIKKAFKKQDNGKLNDDEKISKSDHGKLADKVTKKLEKNSQKTKDYNELKKLKRKEAKKIEQEYNRKLQKGIKLSVLFKNPSEDRQDSDLDFKVRIAPNATEVEGSTPLGLSEEEHNLLNQSAQEIATGIINRKEQSLFKKKGAQYIRQRGLHGGTVEIVGLYTVLNHAAKNIPAASCFRYGNEP
ncbi:MAG: DUF4157 domain-containing protein [Cyanobacteria bacterium J06598_1]